MSAAGTSTDGLTRRTAIGLTLAGAVLVALPGSAIAGDASATPALVELTLDQPFDPETARRLVAGITQALAGSLPATTQMIWVHVLAPPAAKGGGRA